jgi:oligopeptide transport system ATP-binding protein
MPRLDQKKDEPLIPIIGTPPDLIKPPVGCAFCARCDEAMKVCERLNPGSTEFSETHTARCWNLHEMAKEVHSS